MDQHSENIMPKLTFYCDKQLVEQIQSVASSKQTSLSKAINHLLTQGLISSQQNDQLIEQHCHQLIIQMNAILQHHAEKHLYYDQCDFEQLSTAAKKKLSSLTSQPQSF